METIVVISIILDLIIIICFIGLCKNVSQLKDHFVGDTHFDAAFKTLIKLEEKEKAKELLIKQILASPLLESATKEDAYHTMMFIEKYEEYFEMLGMKIPFEKVNNDREAHRP